MFCIQTWSLRKWSGMSCNTNMFLKKVRHVSYYYMTCIEEERVTQIYHYRNYPALFNRRHSEKKNPLKILLALERINLNVKQMSLQDTQFIFYIYDAVLLSQNCVPKNGNKLFVSYTAAFPIYFLLSAYMST